MTFQALLFCPDEKTARVTTQVLSELEFSVEACAEPFAAVKKLMGQHFDAIVVDCENEQNASLLFKSARNSNSNQGSLAVAVVEGQSGVANAFRIGANLVLTKPINVEQAKSTLRVARGLLRKGDAAKNAPAAAPGTSLAPTPAPARPAAARTDATRPAAPAASTPKPSFTNFQAAKPQPAAAVAKTSVEAGNSFSTQSKPVSGAEPAEENLLEAAGTPADTTFANSTPKSASKEYPWQPVSKPSNAMASSLQQAAEAVESKSLASPDAKTPEFSSAKPARPLITTPMPSSGGMAAAPAPAKESAKFSLPTIEKPATPATAPKAPEFEGTPKRAAKAADAGDDFASVPAPSFAALDSTEEDSGSTGGNRTGLFIVAAVAVLAIAGYFGYTKMTGNKQAAKPAVQSQAQPVVETQAPATQTTVTAAVPASVPPTSQPTVHVQPAPTTHSSPTEPTTESEDTTPEVIVTHPNASDAIKVKSDLGTTASKKAEDNADVPAPSLGNMESSDPSALSSLVKSGPVSVPRVAANSPEMLRISQGVTQGLLLKRIQPTYPAQAMQMRIQGAVQLQATINKQGKITTVKVLSGDAILARAAVDAVSQWKYKPYFLNGEPVDIQTQITVNFKLP